MPEIGSAGMMAYGQGKYDVAAAIFTIPAQQKGTDFYYEANYFLGDANFRSGSAKKEKEEDATKELNAALSALSVLTSSTDQKVIDEYLVKALYLSAFANLNLDTVDPEKPELVKGLYLPDFERLVKVLNDKKATGYVYTEDDISKLSDAYNQIGYYYILKENYPKAITYFKNTISINPSDETAQQMLEALKGQ